MGMILGKAAVINIECKLWMSGRWVWIPILPLVAPWPWLPLVFVSFFFCVWNEGSCDIYPRAVKLEQGRVCKALNTVPRGYFSSFTLRVHSRHIPRKMKTPLGLRWGVSWGNRSIWSLLPSWSRKAMPGKRKNTGLRLSSSCWPRSVFLQVWST